MRTKLWVIVGLLGLLYGPCAARAADRVTASKIEQLVTQLGSEEYLERQQAETQLVQLGADAFAALQAAEGHADLEIATRAKYILTRIRIEWSRASDPAVVRKLMADYGELSFVLRQGKVEQLAGLSQQEGMGALCRIVRFDSSPKIARQAALAILGQGFLPPQRRAFALAALSLELGEGDSVPLSWLRLYVKQLQAPQQLDPGWLSLVDAELKLLAAGSSDTDRLRVLAFLQHHLGFATELADAEAIFASWQRMIGLAGPGEESGSLTSAMTWLINREQWEALEKLENAYHDLIYEERLLLYFVAIARDKQGRSAEAEDLANRAYELENGESSVRNSIATVVADYGGRHDWAEREWQYLIDTTPVTEVVSLKAREALGLYRLHDRLEHQAAADLLGETIDAVNKDPALRAKYQNTREWDGFRRASANRQYFLACHYAAEGDYEKQRQHLEQALRLSSENPDFLIAMYRIPEASETYRKKVAVRMATMKQRMEQEIKELESKPNLRQANSYNQWAWLISNTEGDFKKAVERSEYSLKLEPGSPSFLDTLGRCYYAAGELEKAVKVQREAVAKYPHMMVMQRQLKLFEEELEKRQQVASE